MLHVNPQLSTTANSRQVSFSPQGRLREHPHRAGDRLPGGVSRLPHPTWGAGFELHEGSVCAENLGITAIRSTQLGSSRYEGQSQLCRDRMSPRKSVAGLHANMPQRSNSLEKLPVTCSSAVRNSSRPLRVNKPLVLTEQSRPLKPTHAPRTSSRERRDGGEDRRRSIRAGWTPERCHSKQRPSTSKCG